MKIFSLDIATKTGYCVLEDGQLKHYGMLDILSEMNLFQRISFFETNITKLLDDYKPDYVAIEDLILGISGVKTLAYLARLNGIAISCAYKSVHNNIALFTPPEWKANCFDGLNGNAKKVDVQIAVCKQYNLIDTQTLAQITQPLDSIHDQSKQLDERIKLVSENTKQYMAYLNRKKNGPKNDIERKSFEQKIKENKQEIIDLKNAVKENKDKIENVYKSVSIEITSKCGLTQDVSDSIGIAYCLWRKISNKL